MFISNTITLKENNAYDNLYTFYEDIIEFNECYNNEKYKLVVLEHRILTESQNDDIIILQEGLIETAKKIWEFIKNFLNKLKLHIIKIFNFIYNKIVSLISWIGKKFDGEKDLIVTPVNEELQLMQLLSDIKERVIKAETREELGRIREVVSMLPNFIATSEKVIKEKIPDVKEDNPSVKTRIHKTLNSLKNFGKSEYVDLLSVAAQKANLIQDIDERTKALELIKQKSTLIAHLEGFNASLGSKVAGKVSRIRPAPKEQLKESELINDEETLEEMSKEDVKKGAKVVGKHFVAANKSLFKTYVTDVPDDIKHAKDVIASKVKDKNFTNLNQKPTLQGVKDAAVAVGKTGWKVYDKVATPIGIAALAPLFYTKEIVLDIGLRHKKEILDFIDGKTPEGALKNTLNSVRKMVD
jgi:hypothetical protein